jgi:hypothetical protein
MIAALFAAAAVHAAAAPATDPNPCAWQYICCAPKNQKCIAMRDEFFTNLEAARIAWERRIATEQRNAK